MSAPATSMWRTGAAGGRGGGARGGGGGGGGGGNVTDYGVPPQGGWLSGTFIRPHYDEIRCSRREDSTHLRLNGGRYNIPWRLNDLFLQAYSRDLGDSVTRHCLTEVCTDHFPFFLDYDVFDASLSLRDADGPAVKTQIAAWCTTAMRCVAKCVPDAGIDDGSPSSLYSDEELEGMTPLQRALLLRDRLRPSTAVLMMAPARRVAKAGAPEGTKIGLHLLWPSLIVTKTTAQRLRNLVVVELHACCPGRPWDNIVDLCVYRPMSSLRMIGSYKVTKCAACDLPEVKAARKAEARGRDAAAVAAGVPRQDAANAFKVRKKASVLVRAATAAAAAATARRPFSSAAPALTGDAALLQEYCRHFDASHSCRDCGGRFRVPDVAAGCYVVSALLDGDGDLLADLTDAATADPLVGVHLCSPRRGPTAEVTQVVFPRHAPSAPRALVQRRVRTPQELEDGEGEEEEESLSDEVVELVPGAEEVEAGKKFRKAPCHGCERDACAELQRWLNSGAVNRAYEAVQVSAAYRLISKAAKDQGKMADGGADYIVIAVLRGYGSQYCCNVQRDHSNNRVYFELLPNRTVVQKCHSLHDPACAAAKAVRVRTPHHVHTAFFPFARDTMLVLPEEVRDWVTGALDMKWLRRKCGRPVIACSNRDDGASFQKILQVARKAIAREAAARAKREGDSALGKRVAEAQLEREEGEGDGDGDGAGGNAVEALWEDAMY